MASVFHNTGDATMAGVAVATSAGTHMVYISVEHMCEGTTVKLQAFRPIQFREITPVFEDLGINIVSFGHDRQPGAGVHQSAGVKKHLQAFRGSFLVTDDDGERLSDSLVDELVNALQQKLHVQISNSSTIRKSDSVCSNLSVYGADAGGEMNRSVESIPSWQSVSRSQAGQLQTNLACGPTPYARLSIPSETPTDSPVSTPLPSLYPAHVPAVKHQRTESGGVACTGGSDDAQQVVDIDRLGSAVGGASAGSVVSGISSGPNSVGPASVHSRNPSTAGISTLSMMSTAPNTSASSPSGTAFAHAAMDTPFTQGSRFTGHHHDHSLLNGPEERTTSSGHQDGVGVRAVSATPQGSAMLQQRLSGPGYVTLAPRNSGPGLSPLAPRTTSSSHQRSLSHHDLDRHVLTQQIATPGQLEQVPAWPQPVVQDTATSQSTLSSSGQTSQQQLSQTTSISSPVHSLPLRTASQEPVATDTNNGNDDANDDARMAFKASSNLVSAGSLARQLSLLEDESLELAAGQQTVDTIMATPVHVVDMDHDLGTVKQVMNSLQITAMLVDTGTPQPGFITTRDFLKVSFSRTLKNARVKDIMNQPVISINSGASLTQAVQVLATKSVRRLLVFDPEKAQQNPSDYLAPYIGLVADTDIFSVLGSAKARHAERTSAPTPLQGLPERVSAAGVHTSMGSPGRADMARMSAASLRLGTAGASTGTSCSTASVSSRANSLVTGFADQTKALSTEDRYRAAAALWELDYNEVEIIRKIGEGSFGEVMLASFRGTRVAVKRMRGFEDCCSDETGPSPTMTPVFQQFFEREIEIMATIRHPNVVNFIGACHTPPNVCLVTEYCARGSLDHLLHKSGLHLDLTKKIEFATDIARGMSCLHAQRPAIIHRDLKTANLLVSARFEVKVSDFGLSRIKDHAQLINSRAGLEGTVEYCAPEVLRGEPYTEKCDLWSFGVVLWELINRQRPYADVDMPVYLLMMNLGNGNLRLPALPDDIAGHGIAKLVERCLSFSPADRPSFREVLHLLENEYKVVRGKAAAVPRSDSASSMVILAQAAAAANHHHAETTEAHGPVPSIGGAASIVSQPSLIIRPAAVSPHLPAPVAYALNSRLSGSGAAARQLPPVLRNPRSPGRSGDGSTDFGYEHERHSNHQQSRFARGPSLGQSQAQVVGTDTQGAPAQQAGYGYGSQQQPAQPPFSPSGSQPNAAACIQGSSQNAVPTGAVVAGNGTGNVTPRSGSGGKQGRPPRPRRMSRARSTPLPEHMWFMDNTSVDNDDQDGEGDDAEGEMPGSAGLMCEQGLAYGSGAAVNRDLTQSPGLLAGSVVPMHLVVPGRLTNIPETQSSQDTSSVFDSGSNLVDILLPSSPRKDQQISQSQPQQRILPTFGEVSVGSYIGSRGDGDAQQNSIIKQAEDCASPEQAVAGLGDTGGDATLPHFHAFASPFDGFLPFNDDTTSPMDTPRVPRSPRADAAGNTSDVGTIASRDFSTQPDMHVDVIATSAATTFATKTPLSAFSPFSAFSQMPISDVSAESFLATGSYVDNSSLSVGESSAWQYGKKSSSSLGVGKRSPVAKMVSPFAMGSNDIPFDAALDAPASDIQEKASDAPNVADISPNTTCSPDVAVVTSGLDQHIQAEVHTFTVPELDGPAQQQDQVGRQQDAACTESFSAPAADVEVEERSTSFLPQSGVCSHVQVGSGSMPHSTPASRDASGMLSHAAQCQSQTCPTVQLATSMSMCLSMDAGSPSSTVRCSESASAPPTFVGTFTPSMLSAYNHPAAAHAVRTLENDGPCTGDDLVGINAAVHAATCQVSTGAAAQGARSGRRSFEKSNGGAVGSVGVVSNEDADKQQDSDATVVHQVSWVRV